MAQTVLQRLRSPLSNGRSGVQRWGAVLSGGALALYGLSRRTRSGMFLAATGGAVAFFGARQEGIRREFEATGSVLVNCSAAEAYHFWHDFENLPRFMRHLESVVQRGERSSRWTAVGPFGRELHWDAEIDQDLENEYISWHSLPGSDLRVAGNVSFQPARGKPGTVVRVSLELRFPAGAIGRAAAKLIGKDPNFLVQQDLRRLKALMETGEIPTTEGQTHGPRSAMTGVARMVNPDQPMPRDARLVDVFEARRRVS